MDHSIPTRKPDLILINKKKISCHQVDFVPAGHRVKIKEGENHKEKKQKNPGPCQRVEKVVKHESDGHTNCSSSPWNSLEEPEKETRWTGN